MPPLPSAPPPKIAGYILAGGRGRRMGGARKLFLDCGGETFCARLRAALSPLERVYLSVSEEAPYRSAGLPLVLDRYPDAGPMGGICSGLEVCPEEALLVVACDMPHLDRPTVLRLVAAYWSSGGRPVLAEAGGRVQPLLGVYPRRLRPLLAELLRTGDRRMGVLLARADCSAVPLDPGSRAADNINTWEDYGRLVCPPRGPASPPGGHSPRRRAPGG